MTPESISPTPPPSACETGQGADLASSPLTAGGPQPGPEAGLEGPAPGPGATDLLLAVLVCALAFFLASTPARNSDLWLHLASGRLLARGHSPLEADPFSSAASAPWVNHSWLHDAALYALFTLGGGTALVLAKAVVVAAAAGLMFCFRRRGSRVGVVAVTAVVVVLAMGPWLLLQPALLSVLGVVLTLYLLERPSLLEGDRARRARSLRWLLVPLFALWANLDGWFLLGPALVALYALGELLGRLTARPGPRGELRALALLTPACLAACLLTPYHIHTFAWPVPLGLTHAEQALMRDPLGRTLVFSPFGPRFAPLLAGPGAWAYYLLLAAGLGSFYLRGRALHPGRLLAWLALAALSAYQARAIPFFAAAAGPILALNFQEWARAASLPPAPHRLWLAARTAGVLALLALLALAWPGWLQPGPGQPRAWAVEPDPSLVRLARRLQKWHAGGAFPPDRFALTLSPEAAHHLAWFCPAEKGFLDSRWHLFGPAADDFVRMRRCLLGPDAPAPELGPLLDAHHLDRVLLYDPDWERTTQLYRCLLLGRADWKLVALDGTAALFVRSGEDSSSSLEAFDPRREAYHPPPDRRALPAAPRAPQRPGPLDAFTRARDERSPDRGEAALHLIAFDLEAERLGRQWLTAQATGLIAAGTGDGPGSASALALRLHLTPLLESPQTSAPAPTPRAGDEWAAGFLAAHDPVPSGSLLLALRAARRALAADPDDAGAYLVLGEVYLRLANQPGDRRWQAALPVLVDLRRIQAVTVLEQAVLIRPDLDEAHALLAAVYYQTGQMDRALDHLRSRLRIAEREAKGRGPAARAAAGRRDALRADVDTMAKLVQHSLDVYDANVIGKTDPSRVVDRARLAARHGLSRKALEMLLASYPAIYGKDGARMQLDLMLQAGRAFEVRAWLEPQHQALLGFSDYHWMQARAAAACGDYAAADADLDAVAREVRPVRVSPKDQAADPVRQAIALRAAIAALVRPDAGGGPGALAGATCLQLGALDLRPRAQDPRPDPVNILRKEADFLSLRGLLALESGDVETARRHFRAALAVWGDPARAASGAGLDFLTRPLVQKALDTFEQAGAGRKGDR